MRISTRLSPMALLLLPLSALLTASALLAGGPAELLGTLPAILLAAALACGRYPGEELIERLASRLRRPRRATRPLPPPRRAPDAAALRLLATLGGCRSLRGPPAFSPAQA